MITWATPAGITYGTALSVVQLNATSSVAGTLTYTPSCRHIPAAGNDTFSVTFTPTDTADYTTATKTVQLAVSQAAPVITWAAPAGITYGTALSTAQLNATASVAGIFVYTPALGSVPTAGTDTLSVTFTPTDTANYTTATPDRSAERQPGSPAITWATPAGITYGTALSNTQLNATASVAGTFVYTPALGNVPTAGTDTLSVTFTPTDTTNYSTVTKTVQLNVAAGYPDDHLGQSCGPSPTERHSLPRNSTRPLPSQDRSPILLPPVAFQLPAPIPFRSPLPQPTPPTTRPLPPPYS